MAIFLIYVLCALAVLLLIPSAVVCVQCVAAILPPKKRLSESPNGVRPTVAVLVPAHDEAQGIRSTIESILPQLCPGDRLLVIADNCSDETAAVARISGAIVVERHDPKDRGKGFALQCGLKYLSPQPPEVVVFIDADCQVAEDCVDHLCHATSTCGRPIQAANRIELPKKPKSSELISYFAFLVKNTVRPLGMRRMGLPCLLTGTGMCIPWHIMEQVTFGGNAVVEDMSLSVDLNLLGYAPIASPHSGVRSDMPAQRSAARTQRTRWEHGHLQTSLTQTPRLFWGFLRTGRKDLLGMMFDLCVPPLSLLVLANLALLVASVAAFTMHGSSLPLWLCLSANVSIAASVLLAWVFFAKRNIPLWVLFVTPFYVLSKIPLYARYVTSKQQTWVRTERDVTPNVTPTDPPAIPEHSSRE